MNLARRSRAVALCSLAACSSGFVLPSCSHHHAKHARLRAGSEVTMPEQAIGPVFEPYEGEGRFDTVSVGMPRIHRYIHDDEKATRWVMWYHGRDETFEPEGILDIGTGRIGQATSSDGIRWTRTEGPATGGAVFDVNTEQWWGFDAAHVGLGDITVGASEKIPTEGGIYFSYYFGGNWAETDLSQFGLPKAPAGGARKGIQMRIGVAVSQDGIHWSRLEGEHADGSCVDVGPPGSWDSVFVGWPTVLSHEGKEFRMYYHALDPNTRRNTIGLAVSQDGLKWEKRGPVFSGGPVGAFDEGGAGRRCIIKLDGVYHMLYEATDAAGTHSIGLCTSDDGVHWRRGPADSAAEVTAAGCQVLERGVLGSWDEGGVSAPHVVQLGGGELWMYYVGLGSKESGVGARRKHGVGVAVARDGDLTRWERLQAPPKSLKAMGG